ncbi:Ig-like domain-containing protein [Serratia sp. D1N4]
MLVLQEGDNQPSIIIEDYFNGDVKHPVLLGMAEDGQLYAYVPLSGEGYENGYLVSEGEFSPVALGGPSLGDGTGIFVSSDDDHNALFGLLGWVAAATAIGAGAAIAYHNRNTGDDNPTDTTPPAKPAIGEALDQKGAVTGAIQNGSVTDETRPVLNGQGTPGDLITVYDNGQAIGSVVIDGNGNWTFTPDAELGEGSHQLVITETDPAGNVSSPSDSLNFNVDTTPPDVPGLQHVMDKVGDVVGEINAGGMTDDPRPELSGSGEVGSTVTIYDNGTVIGETEVNEDGRWSFKPDTDLTDGSHTLTVSQTDPAGNQSEQSGGWTFTVDTQAPSQPSIGSILDNTGSVTGPLTNGSVTDETQPQLNGVGEPGNVIIITDNGKPLGSTVVDDQGNWSYVVDEPLTEGSHQLVVTEVDQAGNSSVPSNPIEIVVDTTAPGKPDVAQAQDNTGPITGPIVNGGSTDETQPKLSGAGEPGNVINIYDGGEKIGSVVVGDNGKWSFTPETPLAETDHSITVTETDPAGNESAPSESLNFTVDTTASPEGPDHLAITAVEDRVGDRQGAVDNGAVTDDSQPLISGIGTAGDTVFVYTTDSAGQHLIGSAVVQPDGKWSMTPELPLLEGNNQLAIVAQDPAGNRTGFSSPSYDISLFIPVSSEATIGSVVDNAEPHVGPLQKGDVTNDTTPTLSGTAAPGNIVTVMDNGQAIGSVIADAHGKWSFTPDVALQDGSHSLNITATDAAGNVSAPSGSFGIIIDTLAPTAPDEVIIIDNVGEKTGEVKPGETTDDRSPTLSGKGEPGDTITVIDNGNVIGSSVIDENGNWTFTPSEPLDNGEHNLSTTVTDPAGNVSEPSPGVNIVVDDTPVLVQLGSVNDNVGPNTGNLQPGDVTDDTRPELNGSGKPGSTVTVKDGDTVLGTTTVKPDGSWTFTPETDLGEGNHSLTVTAEDAAGNSVTSPAFELKVDTEAPAQPVIGGAIDDVGDVRGPLSSGSVTDDANPTFNGSAEPGSTIKVYDNDKLLGSVVTDNNGAWSFTPTTPLVEGEHSITTTATDTAGNTSAPSESFDLTTDYSAPDASLVAITGVEDAVGTIKGNVTVGGSTDDNRPTLNGTGAEVGNTITVYNGTTVIGTATVQDDGTWSLKPTLPLADGLVTLTAKETDSVGNTTVASPEYGFTVITQAPAAPVIGSVEDNAEPHTGALQKGDVTNDNTPTLKGTALPGGTVTVFDGTTVLGTTTVDTNGNWSFTPSTPLSEGNHNLTASVMDSIGQVSPTTGDFGIVIDTLPPAPATGLVVTDDFGAVQGPLTAGGTTDDNTPTFSGKAEAGSVVTVLDKGQAIGSTTADDKGNWTLTPSTPLTNGEHDFTTTVTDKAGNTSAEGEHLVVNVDVVPGQAQLGGLVDDVGSKQGAIEQNGVTDDLRPTLNGTAKANSVVTVSDGTTVLGSVTADDKGNWSFTPTTDLEQGAHSLSATAKDPAGNVSESGKWAFTVDSVAPVVPTIDSAADDVGSVQPQAMTSGSATDDPTPTLSGRAEANSIVKISDQNGLLGSAQTDATGKWSFTPTSKLAEGEHRFTVTATDAAGNVSDPSNTFTLTLDFSAPDASKVAITGVDDAVGAIKGNVAIGGTTDDNQPTLKGTGAEAGNTITVYNGTTVIGTATVQDDGTWSLKPTLPLADGLYALTAKETDSVGNTTVASPEYGFTVITQAPAAPVIGSVEDNAEPHTGALQKGDVTNDNTPTLKGTALPGGIVTVYDGTTAIGSTTADTNGAWSFTPSTPLSEGNHNLTASVMDSIGQVSPTTGDFGIVIDTLPPAPATGLVVTDDFGAVQGPLTAGATTDDNTPTFSGKAEAGSVVTVLDNGQAIGSTTADDKGNWTLTPSTPLTNGEHDFTTTVTDKAGNTSTEGEHLVVNVDVVPGQVQLGGLTDDVGSVQGAIEQNGVTDDLRPTLNGTAKANSVVTVSDGSNVLGSVTADDKGNWSFTPATDLGQGAHSLSATAKDPAGGVSTSGSWAFAVDSVAPLVPTIDSAADDVGSVQPQIMANGDATDDPTPTLSGRAEANSIVKISDQNGLLGSVQTDATGKWSFTPTSKLAEGEHRFTVTATDKAGNVSDPSNTFTLTLDFTPPDASLVAITGVEDAMGNLQGPVVSGGVTDDTRPTISGTGAEVGDTITVYNGSTVIGTATVQDNGTWSLKPSSPLVDGTYSLTVKETDAVGNTSAGSNAWTLVIDTAISDAAIAITSISDDLGVSNADFNTNDTTLLINGTLDKALLADEWVEVSVDGGKTWTKAASTSASNWTVDLQSQPLSSGNYTIDARVVDQAGNIGSTDAHALTIATNGPDLNGLTTTTGITTDTSNGLVSGDLFSHSATQTNGDMVTRDRTVTVNGNLSAELQANQYLQISLDNGETWKTLVLQGGNQWHYTLDAATQSTTVDYQLRVIDSAGNVGTNTNFASNYQVVIDLEAPDSILGAPNVPQIVDNSTAFTFNSTTYGKVEAGAIVSLVSDVNRNGTYQEGLDQVLGFAKAEADGTWTLSTTLPSGAHNIAFMVWDEAGNRSAMSSSTSIGVTEGSGSTLIQQKWGGTTDAEGYGLNAAAVTIGSDGLWSFFQSVRGTSSTTTANAGRVYNMTSQEDYTSTYLTQPSNVTEGSYGRFINSATFADINRDGLTDVMSQVSSYGNGGRTAYWMQNADGSYTAQALDQGTLNHLGGAIAYDREGDGFLDFVLADSEADSISFIKNENGTLTYEKGKLANGTAAPNGHPGGAIPSDLSVLHEVGAVDIDNNGTVDITAHIDYNGTTAIGNTSRGLGILYNQTNGTTSTNFGQVGYYANVFRDDGHVDYGNMSISMTYADYNGDGWLDLFLSRGSKAGANSDESRIYLNDGTGKLMATDAQALWFGDKLDGGTSLAVDWNHDGKMDIIEVPRSGVTGSPVLYQNQGNNVWGTNAVSLTSQTYNNLTGAVALDYDWDGSMDLVLYRSGADAAVVSGDAAAPTLLVKNTNIAADGTSLQIRIVDGNGINTFYSNTVKLYDSHGNLVATQLINPQASGSSNSMGLVSFFGLNPDEVYSVQLLRITNGTANHVGAVAGEQGGNINTTVNESWGGLTTGKAHDAYVLTAENTNDANNTTGPSGITGTGYNDTFFSSAGDDTYTGGGGWNQVVSGQSVWSATAGMDIVDYSRSSSAITANLMMKTATGQGNDTLNSIEGLIGSNQGDSFTDNSANNLFEGRGGNDTFYLTNGGNDTLMYNVLAGLDNDGTGGNGHDTVHGFHVGNVVTDKDADLIDLSDLLDYNGPISFFQDDGKMELDYSSQGILKYLRVETSGADTVISIDRDGQGGQHAFTGVVTLSNVHTDLETLLQNNQIIV